MFSGILIYLFTINLLFSDTYSNFSSHNTCPPIAGNTYLSQSLFSWMKTNGEIIVLFNPMQSGNKSLEFAPPDSKELFADSLWGNLFDLGRGSAFLSHYQNVKSYVSSQFGAQYWPKQIRLIYAGDYLKGLPGIGALFCRDYQTTEQMTLIVTTQFLRDPQVFARILAHEVYHYMIHVGNVRLPHWLEEGLAVNFEDRIGVGLTSSPMMDYHMTERPWYPLSRLGLEGQQATKEDMYAFYGQANLLIYYIQKNIKLDLPKLFLISQYDNWKPFIERYLKPKWNSFNDLFVDFQIAKYINEPDTFNFNAITDEDINKYVLLPSRFNEYTVEADHSPINFIPPPLSGFIPEEHMTEYFENNPDYTIKWVVRKSYTPILVSDSKLPKATPIVIRWR